jgi:hypothetical protein
MKNKVLAFSLSIVIGQIIALLIWLLFDRDLFIAMAVGSTVGFIVGYKTPENKNIRVQ